MESTLTHLEEIGDESEEDLLVNAWRAEQLVCLGLHPIVAKTFADVVDWHALEALVDRGCEPELALEIVR